MLRQWFFNICFLFFALVSFPKFLKRSKQAEDSGRYWRERFGSLPEELYGKIKQIENQGKVIVWIHAVSVGEVLSLNNFISELKKQIPDCFILISTTTPTGQKVASSLKQENIELFYFPLDFSFVVKKVLNVIKPNLVLLAEKEVWPNLVLEAEKRNIVVGVVNGRMSESSLKGYQKLGGLMKRVFKSISFAFVQTAEDKSRFQKLIEPDRVSILGNMKYDQIDSEPVLEISPLDIRSRLGYQEKDLIWIAASTHKGEEKIILESYKQLRNEFSQLKLVLVPRHPERTEEIIKEVKSFEFGVEIYSSRNKENTSDRVLVVDQVGILMSLFPVADVVFMGGSFIKHGGQNPIEPAVFQKTILTGPHVYNFHAVYQSLAMKDACQIIPDASMLTSRLSLLLKNESRRTELGNNAKQAVEALKGSSKVQAERVAAILNSKNLIMS